jgi:predicted RNA-binding Zn-ribbon protein involved in translation (DUF1610 family)
MTSIDSRCTQTGAQEPPPAASTRKSTLFCPTCGFESPIDENWIVRIGDGDRAFVCPDCHETVATR